MRLHLSLHPRRSEAAARFARAPAPDIRASWREVEWCAIDLELTGLQRSDEIISIGAVPVREGALMLGETVYTLVRPRLPPRHETVVVHKLRSPDLERAPELDQAMDRLLEVMAGRVPVFHSAMVERAYLGPELRRRGLRRPDDADTEVLGRLWLGLRDGAAPPRLSLARLAAELHQPAEDPHHALGDALTAGKAFIALATHLEAAGHGTVGALTRPQVPETASRGPNTAAGSGPAPTA